MNRTCCKCVMKISVPEILRSRKSIPLLSFLIIVILLHSCLSVTRQIIRARDGEPTSFEAMINDIVSARAIFIGEDHDNPAHHKTQLDVIQALHDIGRPLAIGLEMFRAEDQDSLDAWISGKIPENDFVPTFLSNWELEWDLYRDIFIYARDKKIPLIGLNVPREITRKVGKTGFQSLSNSELKKLPPTVTCELDQRYMDHLVEVFHFKGRHDRSFVYFCEAQVLWDQAMAWYITQYMKSNPDRDVVILAGAIHAWKYGIPRQKQRYSSAEQRVIVPDLPVDPESINEDDTDYLVIHR